jgi:hypothetical protein
MLFVIQAVNSTHLYWEFVQSHRGASIIGPDEEAPTEGYMSSAGDLKNIFEFYEETMSQAGVSEESFAATVKKAVAGWILDENTRDSEVRRSIGEDAAGSRLVRDHMWIEQSNHGMRDYC